MKDATIYDVAKRAGVSHQTVSRFLRGFEGIRPATREKVELALAELEYRPNAAARYLRLQRTNRIGLLADNMHQSGPARTIAGATEAARELGYVMDIVSMDGGDERSVDDALDLVLSQQIAGIVLTAQTAIARTAVERRDISVPVARDFGLMVEGTTESINEHAGRVAAAHLAGLGHRRVAYVAGPAQWLAARERAEGFRQGTVDAGGAVTVTDGGDWSAASGYEAGRRLARLTDDFTAIAVANDGMAMGLLAALAAEGVSVPHEVSVVGNDDVPEARFMVPSLSTVALDFGFEGAHVVTSLIAQIEGRGPDTATRLPVPTIVPRASTAAARG